MVARAMSTGHEEGGKPMYIFDFDCCCSGELITGLLAFTKRMVKACTADSEKLMDDGNSMCVLKTFKFIPNVLMWWHAHTVC